MLIAGWASTPKRDHAYDVVLPSAFEESIATYGLEGPKGIKLLAQHDRHKPIGRINELTQRTGGLWMEAEIDESISYAKDLANAVRANGGLSYSIGYRISESDVDFIDAGLDSYFLVRKVDLFEVSVVTFPCNDDCVMVEPKSAEQKLLDSLAQFKAVFTYEPAPSHDDTLARMKQPFAH